MIPSPTMAPSPWMTTRSASRIAARSHGQGPSGAAMTKSAARPKPSQRSGMTLLSAVRSTLLNKRRRAARMAGGIHDRRFARRPFTEER